MWNHDHIPDHNRFLKGLITQINQEGINDELMHRLCIELKFANLDNPSHEGASIYLRKDNRNYLMLYVDFDEFRREYPEMFGSHFSFDNFLEVINSPVYQYMDSETHQLFACNESNGNVPDGVILYNGEESLIIEGELLDYMYEFFETNLYSVEEVRSKYENIDNSRLEAMLAQSPYDWDEIIREMGNSTIIYLMDLKHPECSDLDDFLAFLCIFKMNPFDCKQKIMVSTTRDIEADENQHVAIINFRDAVEHVLKFGVSGITLLCQSGEIFLSRELLVEKYELFEEFCYDEKLRMAHRYLFKL